MKTKFGPTAGRISDGHGHLAVHEVAHEAPDLPQMLVPLVVLAQVRIDGIEAQPAERSVRQEQVRGAAHEPVLQEPVSEDDVLSRHLGVPTDALPQEPAGFTALLAR